MDGKKWREERLGGSGGEVWWEWRDSIRVLGGWSWVEGGGCNWCRVGRLVEVQEGRVKGGSGNMETIKGWNYERGGGAVLWK